MDSGLKAMLAALKGDGSPPGGAGGTGGEKAVERYTNAYRQAVRNGTPAQQVYLLRELCKMEPDCKAWREDLAIADKQAVAGLLTHARSCLTTGDIKTLELIQAALLSPEWSEPPLPAAMARIAQTLSKHKARLNAMRAEALAAQLATEDFTRLNAALSEWRNFQKETRHEVTETEAKAVRAAETRLAALAARRKTEAEVAELLVKRIPALMKQCRRKPLLAALHRLEVLGHTLPDRLRLQCDDALKRCSRRRKVRLFLAILVIVMLLAGCAGYAIYRRWSTKREAECAQYVASITEILEQGDIEAAKAGIAEMESRDFHNRPETLRLKARLQELQTQEKERHTRFEAACAALSEGISEQASRNELERLTEACKAQAKSKEETEKLEELRREAAQMQSSKHARAYSTFQSTIREADSMLRKAAVAIDLCKYSDAKALLDATVAKLGALCSGQDGMTREAARRQETMRRLRAKCEEAERRQRSHVADLKAIEEADTLSELITRITACLKNTITSAPEEEGRLKLLLMQAHVVQALCSPKAMQKNGLPAGPLRATIKEVTKLDAVATAVTTHLRELFKQAMGTPPLDCMVFEADTQRVNLYFINDQRYTRAAVSDTKGINTVRAVSQKMADGGVCTITALTLENAIKYTVEIADGPSFTFDRMIAPTNPRILRGNRIGVPSPFHILTKKILDAVNLKPPHEAIDAGFQLIINDTLLNPARKLILLQMLLEAPAQNANFNGHESYEKLRQQLTINDIDWQHLYLPQNKSLKETVLQKLAVCNRLLTGQLAKAQITRKKLISLVIGRDFTFIGTASDTSVRLARNLREDTEVWSIDDDGRCRIVGTITHTTVAWHSKPSKMIVLFSPSDSIDTLRRLKECESAPRPPLLEKL